MALSSTVRVVLSAWINTLLAVVPLRSRATFVEILCACLISPEGWVTSAISAIHRGKTWTTYFKLLERGSVRTLALARATLGLVMQTLPAEVLTLVIDDTLIPRTSKKAPGVEIRHDHSNKVNRPTFLLAQCWVTLGVSVVSPEGISRVLPILSRLVPKTGNTNKLKIAGALVRAVSGVSGKPVRVLFDAWFMRARMVLPLLRRQQNVIGQVRRDTALFLPPEIPAKGKRGRPRIYGDKLTPEQVAALPASEIILKLYGKDQRIRLRSTLAVARFLKGRWVRAVWCEFHDEDKQKWSTPRLLLASEYNLMAQAIVELYARRWGIEPLFHDMKHRWGMTQLWQQSRTVLELWMQIRSVALTMVQMLSLVACENFPITTVGPWRLNTPLTAGLVAQWLRMEFTGLAFRDGYDTKSRIFSFPEPRNHPRLRL